VNLLNAICDSQHRPSHHPKSAIGKNLDIKVLPNSRIKFHALQIEGTLDRKKYGYKVWGQNNKVISYTSIKIHKCTWV
jgi:hypothetical protein